MTDPATPTDPADPFEPLDQGVAVAVDETGGESVGDEQSDDDESSLSFIYELPILILVALVVAVVITTFLIQIFFIPSASMVPTLVIDDFFLVNKLSYTFGEPEAGDVVVFDSPFSSDTVDDDSIVEKVTRNVAEALGLRTADAADLIKRIVAVGGDTVEIVDNQVLVNGIAMDEPYRQPGSTMPDMDPTEIPDGHIWVMGDNRNKSQDSRRFGAVPVEDVIGRAFVIVWPFDRWGGL